MACSYVYFMTRVSCARVKNYRSRNVSAIQYSTTALCKFSHVSTHINFISYAQRATSAKSTHGLISLSPINRAKRNVN